LKLKILFTLSLIWSLLILAIGTWWSYLLLNSEEGTKLARMIKWEGATFILLLILVSGSVLILFLKNLKETKSLQAFFSSMTHELKTPLASIRLQADALDSKLHTPDLKPLTGRIIEDTQNLEVKMDKILALSRVERDGILSPEPIDLVSFLKSTANEYAPNLELSLNTKERIFINADGFALKLIFKNLLENTKKHTKSKIINLSISQKENMVNLNYNDGGTFQGDRKKLGTLFYKHSSAKGTGIGLYLCKKLMKKMGGNISFSFFPGLNFNLLFERSKDLM
jgi:signal transduction histidine kinase